jgi:FtsP/CotA-like multicopper oxidase with cupredoxin domain
VSLLLGLSACGGGEEVATDTADAAEVDASEPDAGEVNDAADASDAPDVDPDAAPDDANSDAEVVPTDPLPTLYGLTTLEDENPDPRIVEVHLTAAANDVRLQSGTRTALLNYNGLFPGPLIQARVGDRVIIHFQNDLDAPTTVHWHGLRITDQMDGSPMVMSPIAAGAAFTYDFVVPDSGTYWYHTHYHQIEQFERGLYGALVVHEARPPVFSAERVVVIDDIRLAADNQVAPFQNSGPDVGAGRVGNLLLANGRKAPAVANIPHGAIERWRVVSATNALGFGLRVRGGVVRVIATDGGIVPAPWTLTRVEIASGQRYDLEVRPEPGAVEVVLEALIFVTNSAGQVVESPFPLLRASVAGEVTAQEPVYPTVVLPSVDATPTRHLTWALSGLNDNGVVRFTINGQSTYVGEGEHVTLDTFTPGEPVAITLSADVSPAHPFHIHGQFFQILARNGVPVTDEPGYRDTVEIRGRDKVTILGRFENPGQWMVHCHISEHSERGMMADILVGDVPAHGH